MIASKLPCTVYNMNHTYICIMHLHTYMHVISIIYLSKIYGEAWTKANFVPGVDDGAGHVCYLSLSGNNNCTTFITFSPFQYLHLPPHEIWRNHRPHGVIQWGYLASVLQCLAQTSTFTLDIDANVKSLGAIGQALQKVMKDLRSETRQHPKKRAENLACQHLGDNLGYWRGWTGLKKPPKTWWW